jgi:predicted alpha/beta hydrolase family esterase
MRSILAFSMVAGAAVAVTDCCHSEPGPLVAEGGAISSQERVSGEYLVALAAGSDAKVIGDAYAQFGIKRTQDLGHNVFLVALMNDPGLGKVDELRKQYPLIKAVQPNFVYQSIK